MAAIAGISLYCAARDGIKEDIEQLIASGASLDEVFANDDGETALTIACNEGYADIVELLIEAGANVNLPKAANGWSPLIYASYFGHTGIAEILIKKGAAVDQASKVGCTPLYWACSRGHNDVVDILITAGANINAESGDGRTPLVAAARWGHDEAIVKLLRTGRVSLAPGLYQTDTIIQSSGAEDDVIDGCVDCSVGHHVSSLVYAFEEAASNQHCSTARLLLAHCYRVSKSPTSNAVLLSKELAAVSRELQSSDSISVEMKRMISLFQQRESFQQMTAVLRHQQPQLHFAAAGSGGSPSFEENLATELKPKPRDKEGNIIAPTASAPLAADERANSTIDYESSHVTTVAAAVSMRALALLADASPQSILFLRSMGEAAALAEQQYSIIRADPALHEYYLYVNQSLSSAVLACQSITSGMIDNDQVSTVENLAQNLDLAAEAVGLLGAPLLTGIARYLISLPFVHERNKAVANVVYCFPSIDSHKFIEMLARELAIYIKDSTAFVEAVKAQRESTQKESTNTTKKKKKSKRISEQVVDGALRAVAWLLPDSIQLLTPVQAHALAQAGRLMETLMSMRITASDTTVQQSKRKHAPEQYVTHALAQKTCELSALERSEHAASSAEKGDVQAAPGPQRGSISKRFGICKSRKYTKIDPFMVGFEHIPLLMEWAVGEALDPERFDAGIFNAGNGTISPSQPSTPVASPQVTPTLAARHAVATTSKLEFEVAIEVPKISHSSARANENYRESFPPAESSTCLSDPSPTTTTATTTQSMLQKQQEVLESKIGALEGQVADEATQRMLLEHRLARDVKFVKNYIRKLNALNDIFSSLVDDESGLVNAQSKESLLNAIDGHFERLSMRQRDHDGALQELIRQFQLLKEDNGLIGADTVRANEQTAGHDGRDVCVSSISITSSASEMLAPSLNAIDQQSPSSKVEIVDNANYSAANDNLDHDCKGTDDSPSLHLLGTESGGDETSGDAKLGVASAGIGTAAMLMKREADALASVPFTSASHNRNWIPKGRKGEGDTNRGTAIKPRRRMPSAAGVDDDGDGAPLSAGCCVVQ